MAVKNVVEQNSFGTREDNLEVRQVKVGYFVVCFLLGNFPGVWSLYADVSEHSVPSS
jgi:hypothetical protein